MCEVEVHLERTDGVKDEGLVFFLFPYEGDGSQGLNITKASLATWGSPFKKSHKVSSWHELEGGRYALLACMQHASLRGDFELRIETEDFNPMLKELRSGTEGEERHMFTSVSQGAWTTETAGGYKKSSNPQYLLTLPPGSHQLNIHCERGGPHGGQGLVLFVYRYKGNGARVEKVEADDLVEQTSFKISTVVEKDVTLTGGANRYLLLPCLKSAKVQGAFSITVSGKEGPLALAQLGSGAMGAMVRALDGDIAGIAKTQCTS